MLVDRLDHVAQRALHHPIPHRWNSQRTLLVLLPRLGYPVPANRLGFIAPLAQFLRQLPQVCDHVLLEHLNRLVVHPCRSLVRSYLLVGTEQVRQAVHLIHQAVPSASFHPRLEGRQHPLRPDRRFAPRPPGAHLSGACSLFRHCHRLSFRLAVHHGFHLPAALRSTPITTLPHYYGRSDSCADVRGSSALIEHERRPSPVAQVSLLHVHGLPIIPSPTTTRSLRLAFSRYPSAPQLSRFPAGSGWTSPLASRLVESQGRIEFAYRYGLLFHLPLLRTPPRDDALLFGYRPESACLARTFTSLSMHARRRTSPAIHGRELS